MHCSPIKHSELAVQLLLQLPAWQVWQTPLMQACAALQSALLVHPVCGVAQTPPAVHCCPIGQSESLMQGAALEHAPL